MTKEMRASTAYTLLFAFWVIKVDPSVVSSDDAVQNIFAFIEVRL
jgi:hypothetical protein